MTKETFYNLLAEFNILLSDKQKEQFSQYFQLLETYNKVMDLTNVIEEEQVYERHFYDSLSIAFNKDFNNLSLCDVGSGAGFPAIPLKIVFPNMKLTIIDSLNKRMNFLKEVVTQLNLSDVTIEAKRVEDVADKYRQTFDVVTARAVAKLNILLELCVPLVKVNGMFIALKGSNGNEEINEAKNAIDILNVKLIEAKSFYTENNILRNNYYFLKEKQTNPKYPRIFSQIKKRPL